MPVVYRKTAVEKVNIPENCLLYVNQGFSTVKSSEIAMSFFYKHFKRIYFGQANSISSNNKIEIWLGYI